MAEEVISFKEKRELEVTAHEVVTRINNGTEDITDLAEYGETLLQNLIDFIDSVSEEERESGLLTYAYILEHYGWVVLPPFAKEEEES